MLCVWSADRVHAQQAPLLQGPGEDRPRPERADPERPPSRIGARVLPRIEIPEDDPARSALSGASITVHTFSFEGNTVFSDAELEGVVAAYAGGVRRYADLLEARDRVTRAYVDAGYLNSGAMLPDQDFAGGNVRIVIVEGRLDAIEVTSDGRLRAHYLKSRLADIEVLDVDELRERLRRLKRDPAIDAISAELLPGEARGQSQLNLIVDEAAPAEASVRFDNQISQSVGGLRGRGRLALRNLSGWADSLAFTYTQAEELHDLDVRFEVPLNRFDTRLETYVRRASSRIVEDEVDRLTDDDAIDDIDSDTTAVGLRLRQPLVRMRGFEVGSFAAFDWKRGDSFLTLGTNERIRVGDPNNDKSTVTVLRTGGEALLRLPDRAFAARITASFGIDALGATDDPGDGFADGVFTAGLFQLQMIEYLPWWQMRLQTRLDGQVASGRLLGLERFAVGGRSTVRGYRENLLVKDEGVVASTELRVPLPPVPGVDGIEVGVFSDLGYARNKPSGDRRADTLWSVGLGLHMNFARVLRASLEWAADLEDTRGVRGNELQDDGVHFALEARWP